MRFENSLQKHGVPYIVDCDHDTGVKCVLDIITISDFMGMITLKVIRVLIEKLKDNNLQNGMAPQEITFNKR